MSDKILFFSSEYIQSLIFASDAYSANVHYFIFLIFVVFKIDTHVHLNEFYSQKLAF